MPRRILSLLAGVTFSFAAVALSAESAPKSSDPHVAEELKQIQQELEQAKQNLSKQHERLQTVRDTPVNQPPTGPAKVAIVYRNEMSSLFTPIKYEVDVDGFNIYSKNDRLAFGEGKKEVELYRGSLPNGQHQITVTITMKGSGYGAFAYLKDYKFVASAGHLFTTSEDKLTKVDIVSSEKQGAQPKDRPMIQFEDSKWNVNVPSVKAQ